MQSRSRGRSETATLRDGEPISADPASRTAVGAESDGTALDRPQTRTAEAGADPVVEAYKRDIDRTLLRQNLRRSVTERVENLIALQGAGVRGEAGRARPEG